MTEQFRDEEELDEIENIDEPQGGEVNILQTWINDGIKKSQITGYRIAQLTTVNRATAVTESTLHKMKTGKQKRATRDKLVGIANVFYATLSGSEEEKLKFINKIFRHFNFRLFDETDRIDIPEEFFDKKSSGSSLDPFVNRLRKEYDEILSRLERIEGKVLV